MYTGLVELRTPCLQYECVLSSSCVHGFNAWPTVALGVVKLIVTGSGRAAELVNLGGVVLWSKVVMLFHVRLCFVQLHVSFTSDFTCVAD